MVDHYIAYVSSFRQSLHRRPPLYLLQWRQPTQEKTGKELDDVPSSPKRRELAERALILARNEDVKGVEELLKANDLA
jgi:hypothetical protein